MQFNKNVALAIIIVIGGTVILMGRKHQNVSSIDEQLEAAKSEANKRYLTQDTTTPLSNTNTTLSTLIAQNKATQNKLAELTEQTNTLKTQLSTVTRSESSNQPSKEAIYLQTVVGDMQNEINDLTQKLEDLETNPAPQPSTNSSVSHITGTDIQPIDIPTASNNAIIDLLKQPNILNTTQETVSPTSHPTAHTSGAMVTVTQSDIVFETTEQGQTIKTYPVKVANHQPTSNNVDANYTQPAGTLPPTSSTSDTNALQPAVPMYTIPRTTTLFDSVSMSAILGRVPINNTVNNPFRFTILVGQENLAANGFYIPNLQEMKLSGYAEGDFTLECARGTIDTATYVFTDGTIKTEKSEGQNSIGWISDQAGVPCISGQYITNFPSYVSTQAGLTTLTGIASSLAQSAVSTSVSDGVSTEVVENAGQKAIGDGLADGTAEISKWYAERQSSAFDAVYVAPGERVTVNIEKELHIDYQIDGRKLVHDSNIEEYLGW